MKFSARVLVIFLSLVFSFLFLVSPARAQTVSQNQFQTPNTNANVPNNLHTWTQNVMIEVMSAMTCQLVGVDPINANGECLGIDSKTGKIGFVKDGGGAVGVMGGLIAATFNPPTHSGDYFRYLSQHFGITKPTYAIGPKSGFESLNPIMPIWTVFRNIAYLVFVIVFVLIGLAIMLRVKIDPRTVMTIENQIPKMIIGLILVTFSFAIAGFLIDFMWVLSYFAIGVLSSIGGSFTWAINPDFYKENPLSVANSITNSGGLVGMSNNIAFSINGLIGQILKLDQSPTRSFDIFSGAGNIFNLVGIGDQKNFSVSDLLVDVISAVSALGVGAKVSQIATVEILGNNISGAPAGIGAGALAYVGMEGLLRFLLPYSIAFLVVFIAMIFALFRLWFQLIMAYIMILLAIVFAPFWIIAGLLPGSSIGFGAWLRDIGSNLIAFPATIVMFLLAKVFIEAFGTTQTTGQFVPPLIGNPGGTNIIGSLIGIGFILLTPSIVDMAKAALKAPKIDISAIGQAASAGGAVVGGTGKETFGTAMSYLKGNPLETGPNAGGWKSVLKRFQGKV